MQGNPITAARAHGVIRATAGGACRQTSAALFATDPPGTAALLNKSPCPFYWWCPGRGMEKGTGDPAWEKVKY